MGSCCSKPIFTTNNNNNDNNVDVGPSSFLRHRKDSDGVITVKVVQQPNGHYYEQGEGKSNPLAPPPDGVVVPNATAAARQVAMKNSNCSNSVIFSSSSVNTSSASVDSVAVLSGDTDRPDVDKMRMWSTHTSCNNKQKDACGWSIRMPPSWTLADVVSLAGGGRITTTLCNPSMPMCVCTLPPQSFASSHECPASKSAWPRRALGVLRRLGWPSIIWLMRSTLSLDLCPARLCVRLVRSCM
eukprot:PhM_4_TR9158/c0_g1_i1/m.38642